MTIPLPPSPFPLLSKANMTDYIAAGHYHSLFLLEEGSVRGCGDNDNGQLTFPSFGGKKVKQMAAGHDYSLFLLEDGSVLGCGDNEYGQLNFPSFGGKKVKQMAAGYYHSLFLLEDGSVRGCGNNYDGQLTFQQLTDDLLVQKQLTDDLLVQKKELTDYLFNQHKTFLSTLKINQQDAHIDHLTASLGRYHKPERALVEQQEVQPRLLIQEHQQLCHPPHVNYFDLLKQRHATLTKHVQYKLIWCTEITQRMVVEVWYMMAWGKLLSSILSAKEELRSKQAVYDREHHVDHTRQLAERDQQMLHLLQQMQEMLQQMQQLLATQV